jgi:GTP-binding protein HflX
MIQEKNAIVVSLNENTSEIIDLARSINYSVINTFIQNRNTPDVNHYVGAGKLEEIKEFIDSSEEKIDLIIVNDKLKPSQWFNLEKKLKVDVFDRVNLILSIFQNRADSKEARLQVNLAQLQYERSFVKELIHRARSGEHPGFMAGGEYQVDDYYENLKKQTKKIKSNLRNIREKRELRRRNRHISGFYLVSLSGYTNAGKSSLLNLLSDETVKVEDRLFSTLSTTTRKINNKNIPILLTDTVGFIQDLPSFVIDAFHSTLEEIKLADVVILVIDLSENEDIVSKKLKISFKELMDIGVESPLVIALNKIDLLDNDEIENKINFLKDSLDFKNRVFIPISVKNKSNIDKLLSALYYHLPKLVKHTIRLPLSDGSHSLISSIHNKANVFDVTYGDFVTISFECNKDISDKILASCKDLKGFVLE